MHPLLLTMLALMAGVFTINLLWIVHVLRADRIARKGAPTR